MSKQAENHNPGDLSERMKSLFDLLTPQERVITRLALRGHSSAAIASELAIEKSTVDVHRKNVLNKVKCKNFIEFASSFIEEDVFASWEIDDQLDESKDTYI